jgi:hypothetical protein
MKTLTDGTEVTSRTYYYLLDFNDRYQWEYIVKKFSKTKLCDLNFEQYKELFIHATDVDRNDLTTY